MHNETVQSFPNNMLSTCIQSVIFSTNSQFVKLATKPTPNLLLDGVIFDVIGGSLREHLILYIILSKKLLRKKKILRNVNLKSRSLLYLIHILRYLCWLN